MNERMKRTAVLAITLMAVLAAGGLAAAQADEAESASAFDAGDYLMHIPELKPGNSVGGSLELDQSDAYRFLKYYAESFEGLEESTNRYNKMILDAAKASSTLDGFSSEICERILSVYGKDADVSVAPVVTAGIAFTVDISGTAEAPVAVIKVSGGVTASVKGSVTADGTTASFDLNAKVPVSVYAEVALNSEKIPQSIDASVKFGMHTSGSVTADGETQSVGYDLDVEYLLSASVVGGITLDEVNAVLNGTGPVTKELSMTFIVKADDNGSDQVDGYAADVSVDLSELGYDELASRADSEAKDAGVSTGSVKSLLKGLRNGIVPDYADVKKLAELAHIDEEEYSRMKIVATPYLEQALGILEKAWAYSAAEGLASYYIDWNGNVVHGNLEDSIRSKASAEKPQIGKLSLNDESYRFYGTSDALTITGYENHGADTALKVSVPESFNGIDITGIGWSSFRVPAGVTLELTVTDRVKDVPMYIVDGGGVCEGPGGSIIVMDDSTGFGVKYSLWIEDGNGYAAAVGPQNGGSAANIDLVIPDKVPFGGKDYEVVAVGGTWYEGFSSCNEIASLVIPGSVRTMTDGAFKGCIGLKKVTIGSGTIELNRTFEGCTALEEATLNGTEVVLSGAFYNCASLSKLTFRDDADLSISSGAFYGTKIDPENAVGGSGTYSLIDLAKNISGSGNFSGYTGPGSGYSEVDGVYYSTSKVDGVYVHEASYYNVSGSLTVPSAVTVTSSGGNGYTGAVVSAKLTYCPDLTALTLPDSVTELELNSVEALTQVNVGESSPFKVHEYDGYLLIVDGEHYLRYCFGSGPTFTIPEGVESCDWDAFLNVDAEELRILGDLADSYVDLSDSIKTVTIGKDVTQLPMFGDNSVAGFAVADGNLHFKAIDGALFTIDGELLKYPAGKAGTSYTVPAGTTSIGYTAFEGASLETIALNSDLEGIDPYALAFCNGLKTVTIGRTNGDVHMESGFLISGSTIVWYNGGSDIAVVPICDGISEYTFKAHTPKAIVFQFAPESSVYIYEDATVVTPDASRIYPYGGSGSSPDVHIVRVGSDSMSFTANGTTLTCNAGNWWAFAPASILVDGKKHVDGGTATFTIAKLSTISSIEPTYQPVRYSVVFVTSGGSSVPSQDVYFRYYADVPSDPYRSGFTFTGWYSDSRCTKAFDFDVPVSKPLNSDDNTVYVYAGWRVIQSPVVPDDPVKPVVPDDPIVNPDGSKTTEKVTESKDADGNDVKKVESETEYQDGSKVKSETVTTVKTDGSSKETVTESSETVTDSSGNTVGSTIVSKVEKESDTGKSSVTSTVSKDGNGEETRTVTEVKIESKDSSVATSAEVVKERSGEEKVTVGTSITVESDSGDMIVSREQMEMAIGQAGEAMDAAGVSGRSDVSVTVEIKTEKFDDKRASVEMPAESFKAASESDVNLKLTSQVGSMVLDKGVSETLSSKGGSVSVSIAVADRSALNPEQASSVGDAPLYSLKAMAGDESIHQLGGTVTVTVPYTLKEGDDPRSITVYYVNDQGVLSKKVTSYDPLTHSVTFVTDHFSYYMIAASADLADVHEDESGSGMTTIAIAAVLAATVVAAIVVAVKKR